MSNPTFAKQGIYPVPIREFGDPILLQESVPIQNTKDVEHLVHQMIKIQIRYQIPTLSANELGAGVRLITILLNKQIIPEVSSLTINQSSKIICSDSILILQNPLLESSGEIITEPEYCYSLPTTGIQIPRHQHVKIKGSGVKGELIELEAQNTLARHLQHTMDHLNGILLIEHTAIRERRRILENYQRIKTRREQGRKRLHLKSEH